MMYHGYDNRFVLSANYHGGALVVNYPWDTFVGYTPDHDMIHNFALGYSFLNPPMWDSPYFENGVVIGWEWYITHGSIQDWRYHWHSDIDFTIEVSNTKWPPYSQMDSFWDDNRDAMLWYMSRSLIGIKGLVTDAQTAVPHHRLLEPGVYTVYVEAFGYQPQTILGTGVIDGPATRLDVALELLPIYEVSGTVTDGATDLPLAATITAYLHDTQEFVGGANTEPGDGSYSLDLSAETYDLHVASEGYVAQIRTIEVTGPRVEDFALVDAAGSILVIQDGATTRIADDLQSLGMSVVAETLAETDPTLWSGYSLLIWSAGNNAQPLGNTVKREALESHVAAGGGLLIEGGQVGYDVFRYPGFPSFGENVLHCVDWDVSDAGNLSVAAPLHAMATTPNVLPPSFAIQYNVVADNDALQLRPEATLIYGTAAYPADAGILVYDDDLGDLTDGQIVYYAFNYDALTDLTGVRELLENTVTYLDRGDPAGVTDLVQEPRLWLGPAFPNPANGLVQFRLRTDHAGDARVEILDLQGRRVVRLLAGLDHAGRSLLRWDGSTADGRIAPAGVYFMRIEDDGATLSRRFLWLR
jgi:hypothetical protein